MPSFWVEDKKAGFTSPPITRPTRQILFGILLTPLLAGVGEGVFTLFSCLNSSICSFFAYKVNACRELSAATARGVCSEMNLSEEIGTTPMVSAWEAQGHYHRPCYPLRQRLP